MSEKEIKKSSPKKGQDKPRAKTEPKEGLNKKQKDRPKVEKKDEEQIKTTLKNERQSKGVFRKSPTDHPLFLPLLFSLIFSLIFSLLFSLLFSKKDEEMSRNVPPLAARCLQELSKPFMIESGATRLTCTKDRAGLIISYGYAKKDIGRSWQSWGNRKINLYLGEDSLFCLEKTCLRTKPGSQESAAKIIKKQDAI